MQTANPVNFELRAAKRVATLILLFAFLMYCVSFALHIGPVRQFLRVAGESGTVGGLADWFAVTALFRHPLGIPIPHTALIPKQKARIGASLSKFVEHNFIVDQNIVQELRKTDRAEQLGRWLANNETSLILATMIAGTLQNLVKRGVALDLVDLLLPTLQRIRVELKSDIEDSISKVTGKLIPSFVDRHFATRVSNELDRLLVQLGTPQSAERIGLDAWLRVRVQNIPEQLHGPAAKVALELRKPEMLSSIGSGTPPEGLVKALQEFIQKLGNATLGSQNYRSNINKYLEDAVLQYIVPFREQIGQYIENTVNSWDTKTITTSLENQIGKDLQFIRINGTVVGMLAGVVLFALSQLLLIL